MALRRLHAVQRWGEQSWRAGFARGVAGGEADKPDDPDKLWPVYRAGRGRAAGALHHRAGGLNVGEYQAQVDFTTTDELSEDAFFALGRAGGCVGGGGPEGVGHLLPPVPLVPHGGQCGHDDDPQALTPYTANEVFDAVQLLTAAEVDRRFPS